MAKLNALVRALGPVRLSILAAVAVLLLAGFAWLTWQAGEPDYALLYGDLETTDAGQIVAQLEAAKVPYRLSRDGSAVMVPGDAVPRLRVTLAEQGLPSGGSIGYEIFDRTDALGSSNFLQNVNRVRALEGELARTIRSIDGVKAVRVHLVLPQRELFSRDKQQPSASVLLQMRGPMRLDAGQVASVQRLIASAVPGLASGRVSIIDGQGTLLSNGEDDAGDGVFLSAKSEERRRQIEGRLARSVEELLERTVGAGKVRAQVSAELDFDRINTSEEIFNPDGQVVRSTQTVQESGSNTDRDGAPVSVSSNLPDGATQPDSTGQSSSSENRNEETVNYEISKKVINHVREAGTIKRLSVAVLVDGVMAGAADGARSYQPRAQEELDRLASLVKTAVGFNAERGDTVEVINMPFVLPEITESEPTLPLGLATSDLVRLAQYCALLAFALLALLLVVRPMVNRALQPAAVPAGGGALPAAGPTAAAAPTALPNTDAAAPLQIGAGGGDDGMVDLAHIDGRVRASSLKRLSDIVSAHPEESLAILRSWIYAEE
jgi:flagellar M-ring protein FliF